MYPFLVLGHFMVDFIKPGPNSAHGWLVCVDTLSIKIEHGAQLTHIMPMVVFVLQG